MLKPYDDCLCNRHAWFFFVEYCYCCSSMNSAWMRYHKHMKRKKALLAKKMENARLWHRQRVQKIHLQSWIVSLLQPQYFLDI